MEISACTLSAAARLARAEEFSAVFGETVRKVDRPEPAWLRLELVPGAGPASRVAELVAAETECCSFFTFTLTLAAGSLILDVRVPAAQAAVLDALGDRAAGNMLR